MAASRPPRASVRAWRVVFVVTLGVLGGVGMWLGLTLGEPPMDEPAARSTSGPEPRLAVAPAGSHEPGGGEPDPVLAAPTAPDAARSAAAPDARSALDAGPVEPRRTIPPGVRPVRRGPVALRPKPRSSPRPRPSPGTPRTGTLQISTTVDGQHTPADVYLDGTPRGQSPLRLEQIPAGAPLTIEIRKPGFRPRVRRFQLQPGQIGRIVVDLKR